MGGPDTYWKLKGTECKVLQTGLKAFVMCGYAHRQGQKNRGVTLLVGSPVEPVIPMRWEDDKPC